jgi:glycosyltransferase involved in cell wall biosynthesis
MITRYKPNVLHLHNIHSHITPSVILEAGQQGVPVVWTLHDYKIVCPNSHFLIDETQKVCEACWPGYYLPAIMRRCKKGSYLASAMAAMEAYSHQLMDIKSRVNRFLAPSSFLKSKVIEKGVPGEQVTHLPYLQNEMFIDRGKDQGYILFLGKLDPLKGIYPLLQAARLVPRVPLLLAGGVHEEVAGRIKNMIPANVRYLGLKSRTEVKRLLSGARALVLPSIWYENQPLAILEAFAAGKPVIASDLGGMTELVKVGERGLLTPPGNAEALAATMQWMISNSGSAKEMGKKAQQYVRRIHSAENHFNIIEGIYKDINGF